ncbi:MAG TPA: cytochrome c [Ilumatobacteraceae bacterium]|nr:cytochrome c [Ilumatobacteraceae bacterium]
MTEATEPANSADLLRRRRGRVLWASLLATSALTLLAASCGDSSDDTSAVPNGAGAELYEANCASCHGSDLGGTELGPSQLSIVYEPAHHDDDSFRSAIANGAGQHHWTFGNMPPIPGLDDAEVDAIISFIRTEQERRGFESYERP